MAKDGDESGLGDIELSTMRGGVGSGRKSALKGADLKPSRMTKVSAPKTDKASGGGKTKIPNAGGKGAKISSSKAHNYVRPQIRTEKAPAQFSIPRPGMSAPKKKAAGGKKRR